MSATYQNPIIPGFHPDPSICRVGEDYYLVTSSMEYFPGIPLFHSRDLVHWDQIGHCLTRRSQIELTVESPNCGGIFAPTIRHHNGRFYVTTTNIGASEARGGNFLIWTDDIHGEWSDPVFLDLPGIDPSLFFDGDQVYYTGTHGEIYLVELDLTTGKAVSERRALWQGTGGADREGPHLYRIAEWYYQVISEGGTAQCHMLTVARSRTLEGPWEGCPHNPVLTNRSLPLPFRAIGHADLVEAHDGTWWAVCLGIRVIGYPDRHVLGRETFLVPVVWNDGWPQMGHHGSVLPEMPAPNLPTFPVPALVPRDAFAGLTLGHVWNFVGVPAPKTWELSGQGGVTLWGTRHNLSEEQPNTWLGRRQEHLKFQARTLLSFSPQNEGEEAGLCIYLNCHHHYDLGLTRRGGQVVLFFRRTIGTLWKVEAEHPFTGESVELVLEGNTEVYRLGVASATGAIEWVGQGEVQYLATEVGGRFTGNYVGLYAAGNGQPSRSPARFEWFDYRSND